MKRSRFSETELVYAVRQVEAGDPAAEVARKYGVSLKTIYVWRTKHGGSRASGVARMFNLSNEENTTEAKVGHRCQGGRASKTSEPFATLRRQDVLSVRYTIRDPSE